MMNSPAPPLTIGLVMARDAGVGDAGVAIARDVSLDDPRGMEQLFVSSVIFGEMLKRIR